MLYLAENRMRLEKFKLIRRQLERERKQLMDVGRGGEARLNPARPWEAVMFFAATYEQHWEKEVR